MEDANNDPKHNIRNMYFEEGKNISEIARETSHDRKTISIYLGKDDWNEELPLVEKEVGYPKLDPYKPEIDSWLEEDKKAKRKQRHTARRVYDRLVEKEASGDGSCLAQNASLPYSLDRRSIRGKRNAENIARKRRVFNLPYNPTGK